jgi:glycerol-3-phosphate acyltransferase PlsY
VLSFDPYFVQLAIFCYLAGSIPFGYLIVRIFHSKDISKEGSGNVGALNAYKVSQSKLIAAAVLVLDFLKGALTVYVLIYVLFLNGPAVLVLSCFIIAGHNYSVWLKFKGGRGLASAAGIFLVINYALLIVVVIWILFSQ